MIRAVQKPYKTPVGIAVDAGPFAVFQHYNEYLDAGSFLFPWITFGAGNLTKCYGYASSGTFTAKIYLDGTHIFTVTQADTATPVDLEVGQDGLLADPSLMTCELTSVSSPQDIYIECREE